jgi:hypothetical protein
LPLRCGIAALALVAWLVAGADGAFTSSGHAFAARDVLKQPFASTSIWNMPVGSGAVYVPANIPPATSMSLTLDPDVLILKPDAPLTPVYFNGDGWSGGNRCTPGAMLYSVPIPRDFVVPGASPSSTPNYAAAILLSDGRTLRQSQPFTRCTPGDAATALVTAPDADIYGDGIRGAHGGSGLSSIGGTIRLGEWVPGGAIRHAVKFDLWGLAAISPASGGYRWPAQHADACVPACYGGTQPALRMGALLALPPSVDIDTLGLETEPARMLAWTLQNYGGYVVDDTGWSVYGIAIEYGPDGRVDDEFRSNWGFSITSATNSPLGRDVSRIFSQLAVIDNNEPSAVGGGGTPRQPLASEVTPPLPSVGGVAEEPQLPLPAAAAPADGAWWLGAGVTLGIAVIGIAALIRGARRRRATGA